MTWLLRIVAFVHVAIYTGIMWWGWQSYRIIRKKSWLYMGIGFGLLLIFRVEQFYTLLSVTNDAGEVSTQQMWETLLPFIGGAFLVTSFWLLSREHQKLIQRLRMKPVELSAGEQPVGFWEDLFRRIVSEEIAKAKLS